MRIIEPSVKEIKETDLVKQIMKNILLIKMNLILTL